MDVKANVRLSEKSENLKGFANVVLNGEFVVTNIRIYEGENGPFISMPTYKSGEKYNEICFPITKEFREQLNSAVIDEYKNMLNQTKEQKNETKSGIKKSKQDKAEQKDCEQHDKEQTDDTQSQNEEAEEGPVMSM